MPGRVVAVHATPGARVKRGDVLLVLEAMKMEHAIAAPADGVVSRVHFAAGDLVDEGVELLTLE
jgi:3-methylcrotonyl-CoA carboxylase alpha subunit